MSLPDLESPLALLEQNNLDAAIDVLQQKVNALPAHLVAHVLLARAYEAREDWTQALKAWEEVRVLMPNSPVARDGKRRVLRHMEGSEDASGRSMEAVLPDVDVGTSPGDAASAEPSPDDDSREESPTEEASDSTDASDALERLRRHVEREARRGGARPDLSEEARASETGDEGELSTPEEQIEKFETEDSGDDLDSLIEELEAARIEPDPQGQEPPPPDLESEKGEVVSETLAQIHENQSNFEDAAQIYEKLAAQEPDRADEFQEKAAEMRKRADSNDDSPA